MGSHAVPIQPLTWTARGQGPGAHPHTNLHVIRGRNHVFSFCRASAVYSGTNCEVARWFVWHLILMYKKMMGWKRLVKAEDLKGKKTTKPNQKPNHKSELFCLQCCSFWIVACSCNRARRPQRDPQPVLGTLTLCVPAPSSGAGQPGRASGRVGKEAALSGLLMPSMGFSGH